jgi:hypothetical protein
LDLDADARLTLKEFTEGLKPSDPYSKCMKRIEMTKKPVHGKALMHEEGNGAAKYDDVKVFAMDKQLLKRRVTSANSATRQAVTPLHMKPIIVKDL